MYIASSLCVNNIHWYLNQSSIIFSHKDAYGNIECKTAAILIEALMC